MRRALGMVAVLVSATAPASGSERHFTYTYESAVLHRGGRELEPWNTLRAGKAEFFARLDTRLEAELGLGDRLQTSLYLNLSSETADTPSGRVSTTRLEGLSSEWKLKLADPVADRAGLALYAEASGGPSDFEIEGKLIVDRRVGRLLGAFNVSAEHEWDFGEGDGTVRETALELDAAGCIFLTPRLTAGVELRSHTVVPASDEPTRSALFVGPSLSYAGEAWWIAVSVLPQITALSGASRGRLDLAEHERVEGRVIFGLEF